MKTCRNCGLYTEEITEGFCITCVRAYFIGFQYGMEEGRRRFEVPDPFWVGNNNSKSGNTSLTTKDLTNDELF